MRLSFIIAVACFLGVASASSLNKRSFLDGLRNKTSDAFHGLEHFGHDANEKIHDLWSEWFGGNQNSTNTAAEATTVAAITKRAVDPLALLNDLQDPAKFAQDLLKILADMALQGRKKRDISEDLKKLAAAGKEKTQEALQKLMDLLSSFKNGGVTTEASVSLTKRDLASDSLALLNNLGDPAKFAQQLLKVLGEMAAQGRNKRDLAEDLKKFADAGKQRIQDALKNIMDLFGSFQRPSSDETSTEKTVSKRDVSEDLQKLANAGKEKVAAALEQLQSLFEQIKGQFNQDSSSKTVTKRDIAESLKRMGQAARENAQAAIQNIKDAFATLFEGMKKPAPVEEVEEDSTEVSVSKRSLGDFQQQAQQAFRGFEDAINNFFGQFRKPVAPVAEDTTESS